MVFRDSILAEFDHETANTRRTLERVSEKTFEWRPHEKSLTMQELASHGYVVAALEHPYGAVMTVFPDGQITRNNGRLSSFNLFRM